MLQVFNIPSNIDEIVAYVWGGGGGGGGYNNGGCGGSGGFSSGIINTKNLNTLYIHVGGGGKGNIYSSSQAGYQFGGIGGNGAGAGGGKSGIYYNSYTNGNELLLLTATGSAVNEITLANAASGNAPSLTASGETNVSLNLVPKGTGQVQINGNTASTVGKAIAMALVFG